MQRQDCVDFVANHLADGNAGPTGDDLADHGRIDHRVDERAFALDFRQRLPQFGQLVVLLAGQHGFRFLAFGRRSFFQLGLNFAHLFGQLTLLLQANLQLIAALLDVRFALLQLGNVGSMIGTADLLAFHRGNLDVQVLDLADAIFQRRRRGALAELHPGTGRVEQADGFVGQLPFGDIADA